MHIAPFLARLHGACNVIKLNSVQISREIKTIKNKHQSQKIKNIKPFILKL